MPQALRRTRVLPWLVLVLASALPVVFLRLPPLIDVLGHMGRYELQTGLGADSWLQQYYAFEWQVIGNLAADLLVEVAHPLLGTVGSARLAIVLVPLLASTAILLLSRQVHGAVTPSAVASLALVYGLPFTWGFLNFSLAMALALLAFVLWLRIGPKRSRVLVFLPIGLAIWLGHTFGWAFLGILCAGETLSRTSRREAPVALLRNCWPLLAPLLPMLLWRRTADGAGIHGWLDLPEKTRWIASVLRLEYMWFDLLSAGLLLAAIVIGLLSRRIRLEPQIGYPALLAFAAFVLLPKQIFGSVFADMRLAPYVVMLGLLALGNPKRPDVARWAMSLALAFAIVRLALTAQVYHERARALDIQLTALSAIPTHARIATLVEIPCQTDWALPWFSHIGSIAIVRRHAFANDQWANSSMNPLQVRFPHGGKFATDHHQLVDSARCGREPTLPHSLRALPVGAFTHVWIVGVAPAAIPPHPRLRLAWRGADAAVFRVDAPANVRPVQRISKLSKLQP